MVYLTPKRTTQLLVNSPCAQESPYLHFLFLNLNCLLAFSVQFHFNVVSSRALSTSFLSGVSLWRSDVLRPKICKCVVHSSPVFCFCCISFALAAFQRFYFLLVFQFKPQHNKYNTSQYIEGNLISVKSVGSIVYHLAHCCLTSRTLKLCVYC